LTFPLRGGRIIQGKAHHFLFRSFHEYHANHPSSQRLRRAPDRRHPFALSIRTREPGEHDVVLTSFIAGSVTQTSIRSGMNRGGSIYPMVPGHEIVGYVSRVGVKVKNSEPGDNAGVGCFVTPAGVVPIAINASSSSVKGAGSLPITARTKKGKTPTADILHRSLSMKTTC